MAGGVAFGGASGTIGYLARGDDGARVDRLGARVARLEQQVARSAAQRDRLRAERDSLEARLAAQETPAVCPREEIRTADTSLTPFFSVAYPCGWHVLWEPLQRTGTSEQGHSGLLADFLFVSRLPINRTPGGGPYSDVELADWYDDPDDGQDSLPALEEWMAEERKAFASAPEESLVRTDDGTRAVLLTGTIESLDRPVPARVYVWEYSDEINRKRHVARAFTLDPSPEVRRVADDLVRSFRVLEA